MKKLVLVFIILSLILNIEGCSNKNNQISTENFEGKFQDFSITNFIEETANIKLSNNNLKIEEFRMGITNDKIIRLMIIKLVDQSGLQTKRYSIFYNRDNDYLKVKETKTRKNGILGDVPAKEFFTKLDTLKNIMKFPEGTYKYYSILLIPSENVKVQNEKNEEIYVFDNGYAYKLDEKETKGICIHMYGEPIKVSDRPITYVIK